MKFGASLHRFMRKKVVGNVSNLEGLGSAGGYWEGRRFGVVV